MYGQSPVYKHQTRSHMHTNAQLAFVRALAQCVDIFIERAALALARNLIASILFVESLLLFYYIVAPLFVRLFL